MNPRIRNLLKKSALLAASPIVFIAILELTFALAGVRVPRYPGLPPGVSSYWVPVEEAGVAAGFERAFPRNYKIFPESRPAFTKNKPANGFRVFVLGESTVVGLPYEVGGFVDWLRLKMQAMMTDRAVEVVNAGNSGWYSREIRTLMNECMEHQPDLFVWMVGHNEMVPENLLKIRAELNSPLKSNFIQFVRSLRTTFVLSKWVPKLAPAQRATLHDRQGSSDVEPFDSNEILRVKERFREATEGAFADAAAAGVPIVTATMPKNWRECPPSSSYFSEKINRDPKSRERWDYYYKKGTEEYEKKEYSEALRWFGMALEIDDTPAKLLFSFARTCEALQRHDEALKYYKNALLQDARPMRALPWVEDAIQAAAAKAGVPCVDLDSLFNARGAHGIAGYELITDNVHPNLEGHELIAGEFLKLFETKLKLTFDHSRDPGLIRGRRLLGVEKLSRVVTEKSECILNLGLTLSGGAVNELWKKTYEHAQNVLAINPRDWEVRAALGLLETMNGKPELGKKYIEEAMNNDSYIHVTYVYFYKFEAPFTRVMEKTGIDFKAFEDKFTSGQRVQYENRIRRSQGR